MNQILILLNATIFCLLAALHFFWALGYSWGFDAALPSRESGGKLFVPRKIDSLIVGLGLLVMALYYLIWGGFLSIQIPVWAFKYGIWIISIIFLLRAIGDFRYVGFFKKVKSTVFARQDTRYYVPLCLWLALSGLLLIYLATA